MATTTNGVVKQLKNIRRIAGCTLFSLGFALSSGIDRNPLQVIPALLFILIAAVMLDAFKKGGTT